MKKNVSILILLLLQQFTNAQLVNQGFEATAPGSYTSANAVSGWTVESKINNGTCTYTNWTQGSPEFSIVSTPLTNWPVSGSPIGYIPQSPLGGAVVAQLNNNTADSIMTRIRQTFTVTSADALLQFAYAGYWEDGGTGHNCCQQPGISVKMFDCTGNVLACENMSLFPGSGCQSIGTTYTLGSAYSWTNWQIKTKDLSPYIGSCVTIEFMTTDCSLGSHFGTTLLDIKTGGQFMGTLPVSPFFTVVPNVGCSLGFCANSNYASLVGPAGYANYQWVSPFTGNVPVPQGTMTVLGISNPIAGAVYTLNLVTSVGCPYSTTYTLSHTQTSIAAMGSEPSCPNGASGSATVIATGGNGYTYSWTNSLSTVVSTQSVASGLTPGNYFVTVHGALNHGCGSANATVSIHSQAKTSYTIQSYCGNEAYLFSPAGASSIKWYNNNTEITTSSGASSLTVSIPCNNCNYWVAYDPVQGCRDSMSISLYSAGTGTISVPYPTRKPNCISMSNGSAVINIIHSNYFNSPLYSYSVTGTGTNSAYNATLGPIASNTYTALNLAAGVYSVNAAIGSCHYNTTFNIGTVQFSCALNASSATICPGNSLSSSVSLDLPYYFSHYTYSWSPTTWLSGGNGGVQHTTITPAPVQPGSVVTTVYTVVVTPTAAPCPQTKTMAITAANPTVYSISSVDPICNVSAAQVLTVDPAGGTFYNASLSPGLVGSTGIITPSNALTGMNNFTYAVHIGSCSATKSHTFLVSEYYSAQLSSGVLSRCADSPAFDLMSIPADTKAGAWYGPGVQNNFFDVATLQPSTYTLSYKTWSLPNPAACPDSSKLVVKVATLPSVSASSGTVCGGENFTIAATGASSYSYSSGIGVVTPTANTSYSVWGLSVEGCKSPTASVMTVSVIPSPSLNIVSSSGLICEGETVTLTASGAQTYTWNKGPAAAFVVNPTFSTIYILSGKVGDCIASTYYLQNVSPCSFLIDQAEEKRFAIFPNPFQDEIRVQASGDPKNISIEISDNSGRILMQMQLGSTNTTVGLGHLPKGLYFLQIIDKNYANKTFRIIKN